MTTRDARRFSVFVAAGTLTLVVHAGCWTQVLPTIAVDAGDDDTGPADLARANDGPFDDVLPRGVSSAKLDLLFMVDNSSSMGPLQTKMLAQIPTFISALRSPKTMLLPDLHVAVVSSSFGAGAWADVPQCESAPSVGVATTGDDGGRFRQGRNAGSCPMLHPGAKFLATGNGSTVAANHDGDLATALACVADLGDGGCGFESQFKSIYYALYKGSLLDDPDNGGFLRSDAKLAIVLLTNEDDCSVASDSLLLDPGINSVWDPSGLGVLSSYRCNEFGHLCAGAPPPHGYTISTMQPDLPAGGVTLSGCVSAEDNGKTDSALRDSNGDPDPTMGHLWPSVAGFSAYIRSLKANPADVFVAALAGPTTDPTGLSLYHVSPQTSPATGEVVPTVDHSCTQTTADPSGPEYADPAVRIKQWVDSFGVNGLFYPICASDFAAALSGIGSGIRSHLPL